MRIPTNLLGAVIGASLFAFPGLAQTTDEPTTDVFDTAHAGLTAEELQKLVAPVALYPDTVLIQVLIAATAPLDVIMADRLLKDNPTAPASDLEAKIKAKKFDLSVEVLAIAFPDLVREMAVHIDWTEVVGEAMLAQSDDVLAAVQVMRNQAINSGALASGPEVTVNVDSETTAVVVQPTDPDVVYVPQYDPTVVYSNPVGDAIVTGMIVFGTIALIDEVFDDDDEWDDYWGCRGCADWENGTIVRNPSIVINGDVNIGNDIVIGNDLERDANGRWKPDEAKAVAATNDLAGRRSERGGTAEGLDRPESRSDELRASISRRAGVADISQSGARTGRDGSTLEALPDGGTSAAALKVRTPNAKAVKAPSGKVDLTAERKVVESSSARKPKIAKTAGGEKTRAASERGALVVRNNRRRN